MRCLSGLLAALAGAVVAAGCASSAPSVPASPVTVPVSVTRDHGAVAVYVSLDIAGRGPFRFLVDTGAGATVVYAPTVRSAGLHIGAASHPISGVACTVTPHQVELDSWRVTGSSLELPDVTALTFSAPQQGDIAGLLGSDVWRALGSVRLDYSHEQLTVGAGADGDAGAGVDVVPLSLRERAGQVSLVAPVRVHGSAPQQFIVDTGAARSFVARTDTDRLHVPVTGQATISSATCTATAGVVRLSDWRLGSTPLPPVRGYTASTLPSGISGLVGSDALAHFGAVTLDYTDRTLRLG